MRPDLSEAVASVEWAVANFPALGQRLNDWLRGNVEVGPKEMPLPETHNRIIALQKAALPLAFSVEVGAYINALRTSLDLLATAMAYHYGVPRPDDAYFPVARSEVAFQTRDFKGQKFIAALPESERRLFEALKPYQGGNAGLWMLHQLDILRKHRRLLSVEIRPVAIYMTNNAPLPEDVTFLPVGRLNVNEETVIALVRKGAPDYEMKFPAHIALSEPELVGRKPLSAVLNYLAGQCFGVIALFQAP